MHGRAGIDVGTELMGGRRSLRHAHGDGEDLLRVLFVCPYRLLRKFRSVVVAAFCFSVRPDQAPNKTKEITQGRNRHALLFRSEGGLGDPIADSLLGCFGGVICPPDPGSKVGTGTRNPDVRREPFPGVVIGRRGDDWVVIGFECALIR